MLSKKNRLNLRQREERAVLRSSLKITTPDWQLFYDFSGEILKAAVIIPKKVLPKATDRNQLKRNIFLALSALFSEKKPFRIIIRVTNASLIKKNQSELTSLLRSTLSKAVNIPLEK